MSRPNRRGRRRGRQGTPRRRERRMDSRQTIRRQCGSRGAFPLPIAAADRLQTATHARFLLCRSFPGHWCRVVGKAQSSRLTFPAYSPGLGSYSRAGLRLFYSAGNPTWRIDPMSFTVIEKYHSATSVATTGFPNVDARGRGPLRSNPAPLPLEGLRCTVPNARPRGRRAGFRKSTRLRQHLRAVRGQAHGPRLLHSCPCRGPTRGRRSLPS